MKNFEDTKLIDLDIDVPNWIEQDITVSDVQAIIEGGCMSGAYMPAVTYYSAMQTMNEYGDDVLNYIEDVYGELPSPEQGTSWSGMACFYLSTAVELWASEVSAEIELQEGEL